ncbi:MAG: PEP/pyruvate-binding domain-containing protein, partial [Bacteroidota bacterium]
MAEKKKIAPLIDLKQISFQDTSFNLLMQRRIYRVLLICSNYDSFMLEEDGRIDEQIFDEYVSLNLSHPPVFIRANSAREALTKLEEENIDLIITMLSISDFDVFKLSRRLKEKYPKIPIVILTPFSREISLRIEREDISAIDYIFCWLGNADILLAIIKLIEDKMNTPHDIGVMGVQAVILVEDSIRYYSSYLPELYRIFFQQSKRSTSEGVNDHDRMLRMRGRPKILLATNYEQAIGLYNKYRDNIMGIISDISYNRNGVPDKFAGIELCKKILADDQHMPFLLQSSDKDSEQLAKDLNVGFLNKYSKDLSIQVRNYVIIHLAFGDFIFRKPGTLTEINRATDLKSMQEKILKIPEETLEYHVKRNDFSKWMNARALFQIAQLFKYLTIDYFHDMGEVRNFIFDVIANYRRNKGRGIIAKFDRASFDEYLIFSRIGEGSIGGKARGLAFIDSLLKNFNVRNKFNGVVITIPRTVVLSTDVFDEFMETNQLYKIGLSGMSDEEILESFVSTRLPNRVHQDLYTFISITENPIAIRSSSKLEDSHYQPFAGIYSTYMIPNIKSDKQLMVKLLTDAIKAVYASVFFKSSKSYMAATANVIDEEKMGVILQEVCGSRVGGYFYPTISGVARSMNFYPIGPEKPGDGIVSVAYGLGKYIVDGGLALRFCPKHPGRVLQLISPEMAMRDTQKYFYGIDIRSENYKISSDDNFNLKHLKIADAEDDHAFKYIASTFDMQNNVLRDGTGYEGRKLITFSNILNHNVFPLAEITDYLLETGQREMNNPIEIEFAVNLNVPKGKPYLFNYLQIRPVVDNDQNINTDIEEIDISETIIYSKGALGNGVIRDIHDLVYVKPDSFDASRSLKIASCMDEINSKFIDKGKNYILIGPGRWGSSDPWLGIPVKWPQISAARVIIESGLKNYQIDPSQGTHFFQ